MHDPSNPFPWLESPARPDPERTAAELPEDWALSEGFLLDGRYEIVHKLAHGSVGDVFLAEDRCGSGASTGHEPPPARTRCALKLLRPEHLHERGLWVRFLREAETAASIPSLHVVKVLDVGHAPELYGVPYFVMEQLVGMDLQRMSDEVGPLDPERVVKLVWQVASALDAAHEVGVVHRDLKPENLFVVQDSYGRDLIKVLDFGVAKVADPSFGPGFRATRTGDFFGTPMYMTPEQCLGRSHEVGPTADIWALGLIVHRLLAGIEYWTAETMAALVAEIAYEPMPPPSERGAAFGHLYDEWFAVCCAREAGRRFQSAGTAARALALALRS